MGRTIYGRYAGQGCSSNWGEVHTTFSLGSFFFPLTSSFASAGMGYVIVEQLLTHGAKVYLAARSESRAQAAIAQLRQDHPHIQKDSLIWLPLDLSTVDDVKKGAAIFLAQEQRLDILGASRQRSRDTRRIDACNLR